MDFEILVSLNDNLKCHSQTFDISSHKLQIHLRVTVKPKKKKDIWNMYKERAQIIRKLTSQKLILKTMQ